MDNQLPINRVEMELSQWRSKEERFTKLFSFSLSNNKPLLKEKLDYYQRIAVKYKGTQDQDERIALRVLKAERNQIERQLYPGLFVRLLRRLFVSPVKEQILAGQNIRQAQDNALSLHDQLQRHGFTGLHSKLAEQMRQEQSRFSIPVSYYVNEKERLDHQLSFSKNQAGLYQLDGFKTALHNELKPEENKEHYFSAVKGIDNVQAYNLLQGRSVLQDRTWTQLDFNDKNADGNYRIKEFHTAYGFDLEKVLKALPLKKFNNTPGADGLSDALKQGKREAVSFEKDGKEQRYYIEANPQYKSVNIYDEHSRKITLATATGNKTMEAVKLTHKLGEKQNENQAKKPHLRIG